MDCVVRSSRWRGGKALSIRKLELLEPVTKIEASRGIFHLLSSALVKVQMEGRSMACARIATLGLSQKEVTYRIRKDMLISVADAL